MSSEPACAHSCSRDLALRTWLLLCAALATSFAGCLRTPRSTAERALYLDLRKLVEVDEDNGWTVDRVRLEVDLDPALRSLCQIAPTARARLDHWLEWRIAQAGGPAQRLYLAHGADLDAAEPVLTLERTRALLRYAGERAASDCPFWLHVDPDFDGVEGDAGRWVVLAETQAFASLLLNTRVPALGGGGRLFLGHGIGPQFTLALGGDIAASGEFIPSGKNGQGLDATVSIAVPVLLRLADVSRIYDIELAPVARLSSRHDTFPPGFRVELGGGYTSRRGKAFMPYYMLYTGYEYHPATRRAAADHTLQVGTRLAVDWAP